MDRSPVKQLGKHFSEGARLLWFEMAKRNWSQVDLALALKKPNTGVVNRWLYGDRAPNLLSALLIKEVLGIDPGLWTKAPLEPFIPPTRAA